MKKALAILLVILLLLGVVMPAAVAEYRARILPQAVLTQPDTISNLFPDPSLAQAVAERLGVSVGAMVTQEQLSGITELYAWERGIRNLQGIGTLTSLERLLLAGNQISDIQPLAGLSNLRILVLFDNQISNIQPVAGLTNLEGLYLQNNQISNIQPIVRLVHLQRLHLNDNQISNLQPLAGFTTFMDLSLQNNQIRNIQPLAGLHVERSLFLHNQRSMRDPIEASDPLVVSNDVFHVDGARIAPFWASHGGAYAAPNVVWPGLPDTTTLVSYSFEHLINGRHFFSGTVIQPILAGGPLPFHDVNPNGWFYAAVRHVYSSGIMVGTSATAFEPHAGLTRAMVATILHRADSEPHVPYRPIFSDVVAGRWYSSAVTWAHDTDIVRGVGGSRFAPNDLLTREQLATMMHRFAERRGYYLGVPEHVAVPPGTSTWAQTAMRWAVHNGFIGSTNPRNTATRSDTAEFLYWFQLLS